ncbi:MAG: hypothetical protein RUMPE_01017 [Eubacteriales bacterium SKADARSKE-1]|nr:hypothetical protein [Eubacteriales bacterium SKADARSKE-1]
MINIKRILSFIFPTRCQYCKKVIPFGTLICNECLEKVKPQKHITNIMMESGKELTVVSPFIYEQEVKRAICDFKFNGKVEFSGHLAKSMAWVANDGYNLKDFDFVTAVPLSTKSKKVRGYNQAEILARSVAKDFSMQYIETLNKVKENKKQHTLSKKERQENVKGAYTGLEAKTVSGKQILLCDDIVTTGSTLSECAKVLYLSGAKVVCCLTAAKAVYCKQ